MNKLEILLNQIINEEFVKAGKDKRPAIDKVEKIVTNFNANDLSRDKTPSLSVNTRKFLGNRYN